MIISFTKKFIFFRPKKVGSTTIEYFLSKNLRHPDIWITDKIEDEYFYKKKKIRSNYKHYTGEKKLKVNKIIKNILIIVKNILGKKYQLENLFCSTYDDLNTHSNFQELFNIIEKKSLKNFIIISVIRDPFEQIISYAYHKAWQKGIKLNSKNEHQIINEIIINNHKKFFSENKKYLNYPNYIKKKYFIKLENLSKDLKKISKILNIDFNMPQNLKLRSNLRNKKFNKKNLSKKTINDLKKNVNFKLILNLGKYKK